MSQFENVKRLANCWYGTLSSGATGWRMVFKRALKTSDNEGIPSGSNDIDFSTLADQDFGVGAMFNGADNQHAIVAGLTLSFKN